MAVKSVLVLARDDHDEAMRVAAGLTIFGHRVRLVFMARPLSPAIGESDNAELLELAGITPETTIAQSGLELPLVDADGLGDAIARSDVVVNI